MRWIRHNSVGKQKLNNNNKKKPEKIKQKKYFAGSFKYYYLLKIANNYLSNEILRNSRITQTRTKKIMLGISVI